MAKVFGFYLVFTPLSTYLGDVAVLFDLDGTLLPMDQEVFISSQKATVDPTMKAMVGLAV